MIVTLENIKECHKDTLEKVYLYDYYQELLPKGEPESPIDIVRYWNSFWMALPDNKYIRRDPFFQICDIAECLYNEEFYEVL